MGEHLLGQLSNVCKTYRVGDITVEALRGVSMTLNRGDFFAIMGVSGSGKTTLLNILGCLDVPTSGSYVLNGKDVSRTDDDTLSTIRNELIGFVFQSFYLLHYATVLENVLLPTLYKEKSTADTSRRAEEVLKLVGLQDRADFKPRQLSGGQQQRVAIARALINAPQLLICDEPTGQLDSTTAREIMAIIKALHHSGKTIVLVTHDRDIAAYADKVLTIKDGQLVTAA
ncbi:MAG: ABC transporter ATP-binding protein [Magnetococcales bacterium]|uniref:ABC transporter ATP-binding protein n=1 Tax=Candidatus Magnetobacterium casense TaxID=1455061 RepID=A0ABS6RXH2_9BACT|nr:ABC transporter ATP-binding protein [Candidatus Magnetobacterium casensis]MBF0607483.1 ABC transporter ATP-binding protein [Nitrospirota bacterium]MBV6341316.1 ABC transporter ATP-binding protein [Candidatus Magnetobacterium casensis]